MGCKPLSALWSVKSKFPFGPLYNKAENQWISMAALWTKVIYRQTTYESIVGFWKCFIYLLYHYKYNNIEQASVFLNKPSDRKESA